MLRPPGSESPGGIAAAAEDGEGLRAILGLVCAAAIKGKDSKTATSSRTLIDSSIASAAFKSYDICSLTSADEPRQSTSGHGSCRDERAVESITEADLL
jgi:hypothetical protein